MEWTYPFEYAAHEIRPRRRIPLEISRMITMTYLSTYLCARTRCEQQLIIVVVNIVARSACLVYLSIYLSIYLCAHTRSSSCPTVLAVCPHQMRKGLTLPLIRQVRLPWLGAHTRWEYGGCWVTPTKPLSGNIFRVCWCDRIGLHFVSPHYYSAWVSPVQAIHKWISVSYTHLRAHET